MNLFKSDSLIKLPGSLPANHERILLTGSNEDQTAQTVEQMQKLVSLGKRSLTIRALAAKIITGDPSAWKRSQPQPACASKDYVCYAKNLYEFCKREIQYAYDPVQVEFLEKPERILDTGIADCDSICILFGSLAESIGLQVRYVTIKADASRPSEYSHIYAQVQCPRRGQRPIWITVDATMPNKEFGWEPPGNWPKRYWHGSLDESGPVTRTGEEVMTLQNGVSGMGDLGCHGKDKCGCDHAAHMSGLGAVGCCTAIAGSVSGIAGIGDVGCCSTVAISGLSGLSKAKLKVEDMYFDAPYSPMNKASMLAPGGAVMVQNLDGFSGMSEIDINSKMSVAEAAIDGSLYTELVRLKNGIREAYLELDSRKTTIDRMKDSASKRKALDLWNRAKAERNVTNNNILDAITKYNGVAQWVRQNSFGQYSPKLLNGLSALPLLGIAGLLIATSVFLAFFTSFVLAVKGSTSGRSYIEQIDKTISDSGDTVVKVTDSISSIALWAGVGILGFLAYKHRSDIKGLFVK